MQNCYTTIINYRIKEKPIVLSFVVEHPRSWKEVDSFHHFRYGRYTQARQVSHSVTLLSCDQRIHYLISSGDLRQQYYYLILLHYSAFAIRSFLLNSSTVIQTNALIPGYKCVATTIQNTSRSLTLPSPSHKCIISFSYTTGFVMENELCFQCVSHIPSCSLTRGQKCVLIPSFYQVDYWLQPHDLISTCYLVPRARQSRR